MLVDLVLTVLRLGGLRVVIYPNDHAPAHVHVMGGGREALLALDDPSGIALMENYGFSARGSGDQVGLGRTQAISSGRLEAVPW